MEDKNKTIAARIKELRRNKGITQTALARDLNITVTAHNHFENDKTHITTNMFFSLAAALKVSVHTLLDLPVDNTGNHKADTIMISAGEERLFLSISTEELIKYLLAKS